MLGLVMSKSKLRDFLDGEENMRGSMFSVSISSNSLGVCRLRGDAIVGEMAVNDVSWQCSGPMYEMHVQLRVVASTLLCRNDRGEGPTYHFAYFSCWSNS